MTRFASDFSFSKLSVKLAPSKQPPLSSPSICPRAPSSQLISHSVPQEKPIHTAVWITVAFTLPEGVRALWRAANQLLGVTVSATFLIKHCRRTPEQQWGKKVPCGHPSQTLHLSVPSMFICTGQGRATPHNPIHIPTPPPHPLTTSLSFHSTLRTGWGAGKRVFWSSEVRQLTSANNSISRESDVCFWPPQAPAHSYRSPHTHATHHILKKNKIKLKTYFSVFSLPATRKLTNLSPCGPATRI